MNKDKWNTISFFLGVGTVVVIGFLWLAGVIDLSGIFVWIVNNFASFIGIGFLVIVGIVIICFVAPWVIYLPVILLILAAIVIVAMVLFAIF